MEERVSESVALRWFLRREADLDPRDTCLVEVTYGMQPPREVGESYYWTTPSGRTIVRSPNAYGWPTWYHKSTRHVEVGYVWLAEWIRMRSPWEVARELRRTP